AEDGIRDSSVTGVQTCALPIFVTKDEFIANTLAVPLQKVRTFGKNGDGWDNKLIFGDNLQVMKSLLELKQAGRLCNADGTPGVRSEERRVGKEYTTWGCRSSTR